MKRYPSAVCIGLALMIALIKLWLRPIWYDIPVGGFILGIAPNLLSGMGYLFLVNRVIAWRIGWPSQWLGLHNSSSLLVTSGAGFMALLINEAFQLQPFFGRTFDFWDILFSGIGLALGYYWYTKWIGLEEKMVSASTPAAGTN